MEVKRNDIPVPPTLRSLTKSPVVTLRFCNVLNLYIHEFINFWAGLLTCIIPKATSKECLETFKTVAVLVNSGYALLAGCSQSS